MNEPNKPAEGPTPPAKHETMPAFWWFNPWSEAIAWHRRAENGFAKHMKTCDELRQVYIDMSRCQKEKHDLLVETLNQTGEIATLRKQLENALADKAEAEKHHAEEHAANVRLQQELAEVQSRLNAAIFAFKKPAKRKAKKKGGKR